MTKKDVKWKQISVLTPASARAGDPDSQEYAHGTWLSRGSLGSRSGLMELISTVVNDLYDGSSVRRLQPHLHKADREERHSQRGAAPRSRAQQMTSRQLFGKASGSPAGSCDTVQGWKVGLQQGLVLLEGTASTSEETG